MSLGATLGDYLHDKDETGMQVSLMQFAPWKYTPDVCSFYYTQHVDVLNSVEGVPSPPVSAAQRWHSAMRS